MKKRKIKKKSGGSWHRDATALCFLFPVITAPRFSQGCWHWDACALGFPFPATTAGRFSRGFRCQRAPLPISSNHSSSLQLRLLAPSRKRSQLAKEFKEGFMIGLFARPPFPNFCISPLGIATRKYSSCIINNLSAPHGSTIPSIISLIPSEDFPVHYATINHAIALIKLAEKESRLSKQTSPVLSSPPYSPRLLAFSIWCILLHCKANLQSKNSLNSPTTYQKSCITTGLVTLTSVFSDLGVLLSQRKQRTLPYPSSFSESLST